MGRFPKARSTPPGLFLFTTRRDERVGCTKAPRLRDDGKVLPLGEVEKVDCGIGVEVQGEANARNRGVAEAVLERGEVMKVGVAVAVGVAGGGQVT